MIVEVRRAKNDMGCPVEPNEACNRREARGISRFMFVEAALAHGSP